MSISEREDLFEYLPPLRIPGTDLKRVVVSGPDGILPISSHLIYQILIKYGWEGFTIIYYNNSKDPLVCSHKTHTISLRHLMPQQEE